MSPQVASPTLLQNMCDAFIFSLLFFGCIPQKKEKNNLCYETLGMLFLKLVTNYYLA